MVLRLAKLGCSKSKSVSVPEHHMHFSAGHLQGVFLQSTSSNTSQLPFC